MHYCLQIVGLDACKALSRLDASANSLTALDGVAACPLRWLSVAKNQISSLEPLRDLEHLEVLNAAHNKLQGKLSVSRIRSLKALILNNNEISTIGGMEKLKALDTLVLSNNAVESLGGWLAGSSALQKLSLSHNPLQDIGGGALRLCPNLQELRLNHCHLKELPETLAANTRLLTLEVNTYTRQILVNHFGYGVSFIGQSIV